ncbi:MAG: hypothetical protein NW900_01970, partial [Candidatus Blochmannia sp. A2]|nr:hypothetical protein [Candidatus Blochmannia sp. A2]
GNTKKSNIMDHMVFFSLALCMYIKSCHIKIALVFVNSFIYMYVCMYVCMYVLRTNNFVKQF